VCRFPAAVKENGRRISVESAAAAGMISACMERPPLIPAGSASAETTTSRERQTGKIVTVADLPIIRQRFREERIVLCHGAFDLVHVGHLGHFEEAKTLGDVLVVTLTGDRFITKKRDVAFSEEDRARQLAALEIVDFVAVIDEPSAVTAIDALQPDVYVKGREYANLALDKTAKILVEKHSVERHGGRIHFTSGETFSSTKLSHFLMAPAEAVVEAKAPQGRFRNLSGLGFRLEDVKHFLADASALRVCVLGETVIDEWVDVTISDNPVQSRCVVALETARTRQIGAAGMIAQHLAPFVKSVHCFTNARAGDLPAGITVSSLSQTPIVKTRFVDRDTGYRLFESKSPDLSGLQNVELPDFRDYDVVLLADFGHGLLDAAAINARISAGSHAFVAVMAQVNSTNYGYSLPTKYHHADYYSLNRLEAELSLRERHVPLPQLLTRVGALLQAGALSVTDGDQGVMVKQGRASFALPPLSTTLVDTVGCGDAFFALSSLAACLRRPPALVALTGSIGAAAVAQRRGNAAAVSEQEFLTIAKIVT
jgi:cytidyltransferase-like protein